MANGNTISEIELSEQDLKELEERQITVEEVERQAGLIKKGTEFINLVRPCTVDDGILRIEEADYERFIKLHKEALEKGRFAKFVPASGAASRMFRMLEAVLNSHETVTLEQLRSRKDEKPENAFAVKFLENITEFAFYEELAGVLVGRGNDLNELIEKGNVITVLKYLLLEDGLNYSNKSKALLKFHRYADENRTALEEQVKEGIEYAGIEKKLDLHFTVSPEQLGDFEGLAEEVKKKYSDYDLEIHFSFQKISTDTVALDKDGELFRIDDKILFRPGGHGALLQNLNDMDEDLVYIKNIDNVQREENLEITVLYKKIIAGILIEKQTAIFELLIALENTDVTDMTIAKAYAFVKNELMISPVKEYNSYSFEEKRKYLFELLNRPIRVCGMVLNEKEPGGGPFWVKERNGKISKQIVEGAQVDKDNPKQLDLFESSTHFNPVDLVIGLKDYKGERFDLNKYVNKDAVFVANKSQNGRGLKALELPGLWNGGMHDWISIFVEVPKSTFTPVKVVNDLLRKVHSGN